MSSASISALSAELRAVTQAKIAAEESAAALASRAADLSSSLATAQADLKGARSEARAALAAKAEAASALASFKQDLELQGDRLAKAEQDVAMARASEKRWRDRVESERALARAEFASQLEDAQVEIAALRETVGILGASMADAQAGAADAPSRGDDAVRAGSGASVGDGHVRRLQDQLARAQSDLQGEVTARRAAETQAREAAETAATTEQELRDEVARLLASLKAAESQGSADMHQVTAELADAHGRIEELERARDSVATQLTAAKADVAKTDARVTEAERKAAAAAAHSQKLQTALDHERETVTQLRKLRDSQATELGDLRVALAAESKKVEAALELQKQAQEDEQAAFTLVAAKQAEAAKAVATAEDAEQRLREAQVLLQDRAWLHSERGKLKTAVSASDDVMEQLVAQIESLSAELAQLRASCTCTASGKPQAPPESEEPQPEPVRTKSGRNRFSVRRG